MATYYCKVAIYFFSDTVLSAPDCRAVYVQYFSYLKHYRANGNAEW